MFLGRQVPQPAVAAVIRGYQEIADLASKYLDTNSFKQNWPDPGFRAELISVINRMSETHFRTSRLLRNLIENILEN
jgi:inner membrane protein involved in colicin E2 resistance